MYLQVRVPEAAAVVQGQQAPVLCARQDERPDEGAEGGVHQRGLQELLQPGAPPRPAQDRGHLPPSHVHGLPPQVPPEPGELLVLLNLDIQYLYWKAATTAFCYKERVTTMKRGP